MNFVCKILRSLTGGRVDGYKIADYLVKPVEIEDLVNSINLNLKLKTRGAIRGKN